MCWLEPQLQFTSLFKSWLSSVSSGYQAAIASQFCPVVQVLICSLVCQHVCGSEPQLQITSPQKADYTCSRRLSFLWPYPPHLLKWQNISGHSPSECSGLSKGDSAHLGTPWVHVPQPPRIFVLQHYDKNYTGINLTQTEISWASRLAYSGLSMGGGLFFHWLPQKQRQNMNTGHMGQAGLGNGVTSFFFFSLSFSDLITWWNWKPTSHSDKGATTYSVNQNKAFSWGRGGEGETVLKFTLIAHPLL